MKNKFYLKEFSYFDREETVVFDIVELDDERNVITVAVKDQPRGV